MRRALLTWGVLAVALSSLSVAGPPLPAPAQSVIDSTCVSCHQGANPPAGLDLRSLIFNLDDPHALGWWVRVHDAVQSGQMPPGGKAALSDAGRAVFLKAIAGPMIAHETRRTAEQGRAILRRLNRYEYENTLRDLLSAPWLQLRDSLPEDGVINRFNKVARGSMSPMYRCRATWRLPIGRSAWCWMPPVCRPRANAIMRASRGASSTG